MAGLRVTNRNGMHWDIADDWQTLRCTRKDGTHFDINKSPALRMTRRDGTWWDTREPWWALVAFVRGGRINTNSVSLENGETVEVWPFLSYDEDTWAVESVEWEFVATSATSAYFGISRTMWRPDDPVPVTVTLTLPPSIGSPTSPARPVELFPGQINAAVRYVATLRSASGRTLELDAVGRLMANITSGPIMPKPPSDDAPATDVRSVQPVNVAAAWGQPPYTYELVGWVDPPVGYSSFRVTACAMSPDGSLTLSYQLAPNYTRYGFGVVGIIIVKITDSMGNTAYVETSIGHMG